MAGTDRKNLAGLARAYQDLMIAMPDAPKLVLVGRPGWHYEELMADLHAAGIDEFAEIRQQVSDGKLPALYSHALALVTPSFYEGFGLPALEAMACGTVPIVSGVSSLPEIVGDVGLLIDPHDGASITEALVKALNDADWRREQAAAARRRAAQFRWEDTARGALACYDAVLN